MGHRAQQFLLRIQIEIFKNVRRQRMRQDAKDDHLFISWHVENHFGHVHWGPFGKQLAQGAKIARVDQALDFGDENFADHLAFVTLAPRKRNRWIEQSLARC